MSEEFVDTPVREQVAGKSGNDLLDAVSDRPANNAANRVTSGEAVDDVFGVFRSARRRYALDALAPDRPPRPPAPEPSRVQRAVAWVARRAGLSVAVPRPPRPPRPDAEWMALGDLAEHVAAWENDKSIDLLSAQERKRVYIGLHQAHAEAMEDAGLVEIDDRNKWRITDRGVAVLEAARGIRAAVAAHPDGGDAGDGDGAADDTATDEEVAFDGE